MSKFKFSIIIPAYNPGYKIHECLNSIKKSINFFKNKNKIIYEILIINDGGNKINIGSDNKLKK